MIVSDHQARVGTMDRLDPWPFQVWEIVHNYSTVVQEMNVTSLRGVGSACHPEGATSIK